MIRPLLAIGLVGVLAGALALACWLVEARAPRVAGADTVLVVDGAEYDRAAFERFHGRAAVFPDAASETVTRFTEASVLQHLGQESGLKILCNGPQFMMRVRGTGHSPCSRSSAYKDVRRHGILSHSKDFHAACQTGVKKS